ncbi:MAG TPA: HAMP domain-containing sensor histidine kinase [Chitinophagales bacterium]|nr:HAMP domain-containing sensor histidine kinase [Chitinophagales bacterium]
MSTRTRIALVLFVSNVLIVLLFGGAVYYFQNTYSYIDFYKRLETRATIAAKYNFETDRLNADAVMTIRNQHLERLSDEREYILSAAGNDTLIAQAERLGIPSDFVVQALADGKATLKSGETFYTGIKYLHNNQPYVVIVSADNYYTSHHLSFLRNVLLYGMFFIALLTTYLSWYFSRHVFDPIKRITGNVKQISTDNIHLRLSEVDNNSEVSELVSTFNDLLSRIETAFETQKNFVSNASHELGTPLTTIIGEADVALLKDRQPEEYQQALKKILSQAERLDQITKSLLFLARTGYSDKKPAFELLRTDELIWEVKQTLDRLNPANQVAIDSSLFPDDPYKLKVMGNRQLLHLALANILSNACKYSHNKPVTVSIAAGNNQVIIVVKDAGVGIPQEEIQFIYDPFFRASNTRLFEGYGIGLPLARNIIRLHHGTLQVTSVANGGTTVQINLPVAVMP